MSLRLRLTLVILSVVAVMGVVSLISFRINRGIQRQVAQLGRTSATEVDVGVVLARPVELEGRWEEEGHFLAKQIELLPWTRRPKVRGPVQDLDASSRILKVFGKPILVTEETRFSEGEAVGGGLGDLSVGQRVEVSCSVDDEGNWIARKVDLRVVKQSDKVKGTVTRAERDDDRGTLLEIEGLPIRVPPGAMMTYSSGPLYRMEIATRMTLAIQETLAAAQGLLKDRHELRDARARGDDELSDRLDRVVGIAEDRLDDGYAAFARCLAECRAVADVRAGVPGAGSLEPIEPWLGPLEEDRERLEREVEEFAALARADPAKAESLLQNGLEPFLRLQVMPRVHAHNLQVEEELHEEFGAIAASSEAAARLVVLTNLAGIVLAVAAGIVVARSISRPIRALESAARDVARGNLDARVEVASHDEVGVLATAFNHMTAELARTTLSVDGLNNIIDSMAGALIILDGEERIVSVNPAAAKLLGYARDELNGVPFSALGPAGTAAAAERVFLRKDGSEVPVSFCRAALHGDRGADAGSVCLALDLTDRKEMEERLRRSLSEKELLVREVHHRVKSNLQVISSLLDLQSRSISDPAALSRFQASQDRIRSMVFIHDQLYRADDLGAIDLRAYLEVLIANLVELHAREESQVDVRVEVDEMSLDLDRSLACGLIVNELVTNAFKHAFGGESVGEIVVSCRLAGDGMVRLAVSDDGRGFDRGAPRAEAESLGLSLVETLVEQLHGQLVFECRPGAEFQVEFPVDAKGRAA